MREKLINICADSYDEAKDLAYSSAHYSEMEIPRNIRELEDDTELLKPVDARKLVKRVYVEKQKCENKESRTLVQIKTNIRPEMSALEKFNERFSRFRK